MASLTTGGADRSPFTLGFERSRRTNWAATIAIAADQRITPKARAVGASARDNLALDRAVTEVVKERVRARRECRQIDRDRLARLHDALAMQLEAFELDRRVAGVGDLQFDRCVGRQGQARGLDGAGVKAEL